MMSDAAAPSGQGPEAAGRGEERSRPPVAALPRGMFDAPHSLSSLQRTRGRAFVSLAAGERLTGLSQEGSAKVFLPRIHGPRPEAVFLNTSGGLTGGDRLDYAVTLEAGARAVATTQTAERAYASAGGEAVLDVRLQAAAGAELDWLPQETILFDRSSLRRRTSADLAGDARLVICESVVLGRAAMGETLTDFALTDWREIRRDGAPVLVEPLRLNAETLAGGPALIGGARAVATLALVAQGAEDAVDALRAALPEDIEAAASGWDGKCVVRMRAADLMPLKRAMAAVLNVMRGRALPRVWQI